MSLTELALHNGGHSAAASAASPGLPPRRGAAARCCFAVNGVVLEVKNVNRAGLLYRTVLCPLAGRDLTLASARANYDPHFGMPDRLSDMSDRAKAAQEHYFMAGVYSQPGAADAITAVARLVPG
jgi:hypothetical protein